MILSFLFYFLIQEEKILLFNPKLKPNIYIGYRWTWKSIKKIYTNYYGDNYDENFYNENFEN